MSAVLSAAGNKRLRASRSTSACPPVSRCSGHCPTLKPGTTTTNNNKQNADKFLNLVAQRRTVAHGTGSGLLPASVGMVAADVTTTPVGSRCNTTECRCCCCQCSAVPQGDTDFVVNRIRVRAWAGDSPLALFPARFQHYLIDHKRKPLPTLVSITGGSPNIGPAAVLQLRSSVQWTAVPTPGRSRIQSSVGRLLRRFGCRQVRHSSETATAAFQKVFGRPMTGFI